MKVLRFLSFLVLSAVLGLQGCLPGASSQPAADAGPVSTVVTIQSVEILQSESPAQILVVVEAVLPNTCARLGEPSVERDGRVFTINLPGEQAGDQGCQPAGVSQARVIPLPAAPLQPGNYLVLVNGRLSSFQVAAPASGQPGPDRPTATAAAVEPTPTPLVEPTQAPTPTATPSPVEIVIPTLTPTATFLPLPNGSDHSSCVNKGAFYGTLTVPDGTPFSPGAKIQKTWLVMNVGTCTWGAGYSLVFVGGDPLGAPTKIALPKASPRQVVQITADMTAPVIPHAYESRWALESPEGYIFGLGNPPIIPLVAKISVVPLPVGVPTGLDCGALRQQDLEEQVLEEINQTRAQFGLYPLVLVEEISQVALKHSLEMACFDRTSHHGRDGMLYNVRLQRDGILFSTSNEIIYSGNGGPKGAIQWWMNSPIHKPIVLSDRYTQVGIGFVFYENNPYKQRITVDFILPP